MFRGPRRRRFPSSIVLLTVSLVTVCAPSHADSPFLRKTSTADRAGAESDTREAVLALGPRTVTVQPGSNAILELAIDHLNRIVTPFSRPSVRTVSSISTEVDGHVLYVATAEETPATLYISDADDARTTIGLTLAPRRVPPREIRLRVPGIQARASTDAKAAAVAEQSGDSNQAVIAATWRQPQPYIAELTAGFQALAQGRVPEGYTERRARPSETLSCGDALSIRRDRAFDGGPLRFVTAQVRVKRDSKPTLDERRCRLRSGEPIAAVAFWPSEDLSPGAEAELLVAVRLDREDNQRQTGVGREP